VVLLLSNAFRIWITGVIRAGSCKHLVYVAVSIAVGVRRCSWSSATTFLSILTMCCDETPLHWHIEYPFCCNSGTHDFVPVQYKVSPCTIPDKMVSAIRTPTIAVFRFVVFIFLITYFVYGATGIQKVPPCATFTDTAPYCGIGKSYTEPGGFTPTMKPSK